MAMDLTPKQIVQQLSEYIIGQEDAKKAVAIALRNRYRRMQLPEELKNEVVPKNNDRANRCWKDGDCSTYSKANRSSIYQGGGNQIYRGWLCWT